MKRIFVDTNILLDVLLERHPFCVPAQILWTLAEKKKIQAGISTISVSNIFFIIKKLASAQKAYQAIETLVEIFKLVELNPTMMTKAIQARFADFEDALQYYSALKFKAQGIISRDPDGFKESKIPVLDCSQYLTQFPVKF